MRNRNFIGGFMAVAVLLVINLACTGYGTKLEFNGGDLYYTNNVTEAEAKKLGAYLTENGFYDGTPKSVQLDKSGSTYQFRMVVQPEKQNDEATAEILKEFGSQVSSAVFNNAPLEVHICDDQFKTLRVVKP
jgi:preprotein translocase subunit SecF